MDLQEQYALPITQQTMLLVLLLYTLLKAATLVLTNRQSYMYKNLAMEQTFT